MIKNRKSNWEKPKQLNKHQVGNQKVYVLKYIPLK